MTTISIVTPSYNQGEFIEETIRSVISQKGNFFIDYIIVDGVSTDKTLDIIRKYEKLINEGIWELKCHGLEFRWVSEKDRGQTHALNKGFKMVKGEIVSWINSDDMYFDNAFNIVTNYFFKHPEVDFVYGDGDVVDENRELQWEWLSRPYDFDLLKSYHFLWNDFTNYIMQQATFWKKIVFDKMGFLDESFHFAMDVEYWVRAGANGLKIEHIPEKLGKFRMITGTKSLSNPTAFWPDMLEIFRRYNGARKMARFFSYFFYNISIHNGFDMANARLQKTGLFKRWNGLDNDEINMLAKKMGKGFKKACLLSMNRAFLGGDRHIALKISRDTLRKYPLLILHPLIWIFFLKCLSGRAISGKLNKFKKELIAFYRKRKFQYRYLESKRKKKTGDFHK
jgi:glycosyltransferase involved in cell wall biosynthesis